MGARWGLWDWSFWLWDTHKKKRVKTTPQHILQTKKMKMAKGKEIKILVCKHERERIWGGNNKNNIIILYLQCKTIFSHFQPAEDSNANKYQWQAEFCHVFLYLDVYVFTLFQLSDFPLRFLDCFVNTDSSSNLRGLLFEKVSLITEIIRINKIRIQ